MSADFSPELRKELLDDFYAECDELLSAARQSLTALEQALAAGQGGGRFIEEFFRGVHTLKGIAAIAGVRPAEQLAHAMEDLLRTLSQNERALDADRLERLFAGAQGLGQIISAHRAGRTLPDYAELADALRSNAQVTPTRAPAANERAAAAPASVAASLPGADASLPPAGEGNWRAIFSPSPELDRRGVNVASVRHRLQSLGEISSARPLVQPNGISFVFSLTLPGPPVDADGWASDGVRFEPVTPPVVPPVVEEGAADPSALSSAGHPEAPAHALSLAPSHLVRVDLTRLDELMRITGEMVIQRSRLQDRIEQQFGGHEVLKQIDLGFARSLRELRRAITRVRLVAIAEIFTRMPFVVRDLATGSGKEARVVLEGAQTEIDKYLAERLKEPLLHLVRNAFSHGIETADERVAAGKPAEATLTLQAVSRGDFVDLEVRDDGRGIDAAAVVARARKLGVSVPAHVDANALLGILCAPGFSTRESADRAAGRGVGMAVVAATIRELGGTLALATTMGQGTTFSLRLPLTLSIADAIIVAVGAEICAVPQGAVDEIFQISKKETRRIRDAEVVSYRGGLLPLARLRARFGLEPAEGDTLTVMVVSSERGATGLAVDRAVTRREVVVRPLTDPLVRVPGISGATELGDGRPILILDPQALTRGVVRPPADAPAAAAGSFRS